MEGPQDLPDAAHSVFLNDLARPYFRGQWLTIDERCGWGVTCHLTDAQGGMYHYRAPWEQIQEATPR